MEKAIEVKGEYVS